MKKPRLATEEERALFARAMRDGTESAKRAVKSPAKAQAPKASSKPARAPQSEARPSGPPGLDGRTETRLRRGRVTPEAHLDLHGLTEAQAHAALEVFLARARGAGTRLALVVTGRSGVLHAAVPRWLGEPGFSAHVAQTRRAHIRHGGEGALYVYLRKPGAKGRRAR